MKITQWSDESIVKNIQTGGILRDQALYYVSVQLDWNNLVVAHVLKNSGNQQDGEDLAQETLIFFDRNIRLKKFKGDSALKTYFFSIARLQWLKKLRDRKPMEKLEDAHYDESVNNLEDLYINEEKKHFLSMVLDQIGDRCKQILRLWQLDYSMEEIATQVDINTSALAKKEAYRCRMRMRKFLDQNPGWKDLIY